MARSTPPPPTPPLPAARLLAWYDRERRDLPWRAARDPWAIWVSEVMLQQTRVETVLGYYARFLARFPTPEALASSSEEELLALWSGLGYYRRARSLRLGAQRAVAAGGIPRSAAELRRLPGVGDYTAAAVASIAFGEPVAVVDGNVARVAARLEALAEPVGTAAGRRVVAGRAAALLDPARPGDSNQALMELGATVCTPRRPNCTICPLVAECAAYRAGAPERYPVAKARRRSVPVALAAAAVESGGRYLLLRRGDAEPLLPGLWELPACEGELPDAERFAARYGGDWRFGRERARVRHAVTFRALSIKLFDASFASSAVAEGEAAGWFTPSEALALPVTGATRKMLRTLTGAAPG